MFKWITLIVVCLGVGVAGAMYFFPREQVRIVTVKQPAPEVATSIPEKIYTPVINRSRNSYISGGGLLEETPTPTIVPELPPEIPTVPSPVPTSVPGREGIEALQEIAQASPARDRENSLIPFFGNSRASAPSASSAAPIATPTATPPQEFLRVGGQARGYTMLYLMHPRARASVEKQVQTLLKAQINEPYLGVLVDGSFGEDYEYLASVIRRLTFGERRLTLVVYMTNGASQRSFATTPVLGTFTSIDPLLFRDFIQHDRQIRDNFTSVVRKTIPIFDLNRRLGRSNRNIAIVMLEDNLDRDSYRAMRSITTSILRDRIELVRNACPGCFSGNDTDPFGDQVESHNPDDIFSDARVDGFSLDGVGYSFPGESPDTAVNIEELKNLLTASLNKGVKYFGLWRGDRQGVAVPVKSPDERDYAVPTEAQAEIEMELLRHGLTLVN